MELYSLEETRKLLVEIDWQRFRGQGRYKNLRKENIKLYNSVLYYSQVLEKTMKQYNHYPSTYNFSHRMMFIVERNANIESMKCSCGATYNWTGHCRKCSELKNTLSRASVEDRKARIQKQSLTMRKKFGEEFRKEGKSPRYDLESIQVLETFGKKHGLNLRHAERGGEKYLESLGFWLDGYDEERNILVEVDEPFHFRKDLILPEKDIQRQKAIQEELQCTVYRIYFNKRTGRTVLYHSPDQPNNWSVNDGLDLCRVVGFNKNGTKRYSKYE